MNTTYTHKDHTISFLEGTGEFKCVILGEVRRFSSLKSAKNAINKAHKTNFKPVDVLRLERNWPSDTFKVKKVRLVGFRKSRGGIFAPLVYVLKNGETIRTGVMWGIDAVYPVGAKKELEDYGKRLTELYKERQRTMDSIGKIQTKLERMAKDYIPKS